MVHHYPGYIDRRTVTQEEFEQVIHNHHCLMMDEEYWEPPSIARNDVGSVIARVRRWSPVFSGVRVFVLQLARSEIVMTLWSLNLGRDRLS